MAFEPFGLVGGVTVGIPPVLVIDSNGNITSNRGNIANLSTVVINSSGNITAPYFIGNVIGNISANIVVPGTNTSLLFNQEGNAGASDNLQFNFSTNVLSLTGNLSVTGNINTGNINAVTLVTANQISGLLITGAQPNITSVGTLATLNVLGNVNASNFIGNFIGNFVGNITSANFASYAGNVTVASQPNITSVGTLTSLAVNGPITATNITANTGIFTGNGSGLSHLQASNIVGTVANATYANTAGTTSTAETVTTNSQPNITSVGTLTSLVVSGNITGANVAGGNLVSANYISGRLTTNAQPNITSVGTLTTLAVSGNITATNITSTTGRFAGNGSGLTNLSGANIVGAIANATYAVTAGSSITANTVVDNAQPNITSVGALTSLVVSGNITGANVAGGNLVSANYISGRLTTALQPNITSVGTLTSLAVSGNITGVNFTTNTGRFAGNGSGLTNLSGANIVGAIANATYAVSAGSSTTANTVVDNAQPNITSVGTLTGLSSTGNITAPYFIGNVIGNVSGNIVVPGTNTSVIFNQEGYAGASNALKFNYNSNVLTLIGNVVSNYFIGNGSRLSQLTGANVIGTVANATYAVTAGSTTTAGTVTTNAQPNITSVGTLTSLAVSGNITGANIAGGNLVSANYVTGTLTTGAQPNITSVGALTTLAVSGNITAVNFTANTGRFTGNGSGLSQLTGSNVVGAVANATYAVSAGNSATAGTVTTNAQPNITSVGTLTTLAVSGNITGANIAGGNLVSANYISGRLTTNAQPNITSVGTLTGLSSSGNITAPYFFGNLIGNIDNANYAVYAGNVVNPLQPNITTVGTLTNLRVSGNIIGGNLVSANFLTGILTTQTQANIYRLGNLEFLNVDSNLPGANGNITFNGSMSGTGPQSDIDITGDLYVSNIYATIVGGVLSTNEQPNVTLVGTLTELTVRGPVDLGEVSNLHISGGTNGQVLATDGAGNLYWGTGGGGGGNGTPGGANTQVQFNNAGVFAGATSFTFNNLTNTLAVLGNITSNNTIQSSRFISNVATGTAPFIVTSTTQVANLNVATAGTATFATSSTNSNVAITVSANAQPNITSVGTLTVLTVTGNVNASNFVGNFVGNITSANFASYAGNVTVASQPIITSLGTLTVLAVNGPITATNITANTGVFTGNGSALTALNASNISSGTLAQSRLANASVTLGNTTLTLGSTVTTVAGLNSVTSTTFVGSLTGTATSATTAGTVTTNAQPNITSTGTLTDLSVTGTLQVGTVGQLSVLGTVNTAGSSNVNLGNVANIHITGGTNGYVLSTDGAGNLSWSAGGGGSNGVPGGSNTQIQYNDSGVFGGSSSLTFNEVTNTFQVTGNLVANSTQVGAGIYKFSTQYVYSATTASTTAGQILWSTLAANVSGVDFHIIATDNTGATRQSAKISSLLYGNSVVFNEYGGLQINGGTGSFSVEYNAGNIIVQPSVRLIVTPDSSNSTTYKMMITEYAP